MRKFLCFIGWHAWTYTGEAHRECVHCPRQEVADGDLDFNVIFWRSTAPTPWLRVFQVVISIIVLAFFAAAFYDSVMHPEPARSVRQA